MTENKTNIFIEKANKKHDYFYDYSKSVVINDKTKVIIICPKHGEFLQRVGHHISSGNGCKICTFELTSKRCKWTKEQFIEKAILLNKNYDYTKSIYIDSNTHLEIICDLHGSFWQTPNCHINAKHDCPRCAEENNPGGYNCIYKTNPNLELYIYHFQLEDENGIFYKIGLSINPNERINQLTNLKSKKILEIQKGYLKDLFPLEQEFHKLFKIYNIQYKPIALKGNGYNECYKW